MHDNLSLATDERGKNLQKWPLNQLVDMEGFKLDSTTGYNDKHDMIEIITRSHRIAACEISLSLDFPERILVPGRDANYLDLDLDEDL